MLVLLIEKYRNGDPTPVYARLRASGRGIPAGLRYLNSWVTEDLGRCFQVMEVSDESVLETWMESWRDLVEFEVIPVITSSEAAERV